MIRIRTESGDTVELITMRERHNPSVDVSSTQIESGAEVTDHSREKPYEFTETVMVSETPLDLPGNNTAETLPDDAEKFFERIEGKPVKVVSERKGSFPNVVLKSWGHEITTQRAVGYTLEFEQVQFADFETVRIPPTDPAPRHESSAPDEQSVGRREKKQRPPQQSGGGADRTESPKETDTEKASTLYGIVN